MFGHGSHFDKRLKVTNAFQVFLIPRLFFAKNVARVSILPLVAFILNRLSARLEKQNCEHKVSSLGWPPCSNKRIPNLDCDGGS